MYLTTPIVFPYSSVTLFLKKPQRRLQENNPFYFFFANKQRTGSFYFLLLNFSNYFQLCWGSGLGSGSACFWASRIRIRLRILPIPHKCVERTEIMLDKYRI